MDELLSLRKKDILKEIVRSYIYSAEPIGSRTISKHLKFDLSPASIRNIMADLEELGYIRQVHVSSGRIPTDKGYRFYVDDIISFKSLPKEKILEINKGFYEEKLETEYILKYASKVLSRLSKCAGLVMFNKMPSTAFKHLKFIKINERKILCVFVTDFGVIQNRIIEFDRKITQDSLDSISNYLNSNFSGLTLDEVRNNILNGLSRDKENYNKQLRETIEIVKSAFIDDEVSEVSDVYVGGQLNIFEHQDFLSDVSKIKSLFKTFDEKKNLIKLLDNCLDRDGVSILIGLEGEMDEMQSCSLVTHTYKIGDKVMGVMGIVGPKRMQYSKIIPVVDYTANLVSKILSDKS